MKKVNYRKRFVGQELDDSTVRNSFIRHLKICHDKFTTPWWDCEFNRWLVYEATIYPCGVRVVSIARDFVTLCADCDGVQKEGICLEITFKVPTRMFDTNDLLKMIGPYQYHRKCLMTKFEWFPSISDPRINPKYITKMSWWYDEFHDESDEEEE